MVDYKMIEAMAKGAVKGALEKPSDAITKITKNALAKIKVNLDTAFTSYLDKSYTKYSTIKTLLYKDEFRKLHDFFVVPNLRKGNKKKESIISAQNSRSVRNFFQSNFAIVQGTGGAGKSMLMKHLFLSELETRDFIPVFFELKDINKQDGDYNLIDAIFEGMNILVESTSKAAVKYALERGMFMILLDGLDEIDGNKSKDFTEKLNDFCDKYSLNTVIMSSRPIDDFISFEKFAVLETMPLNKTQAISLIEKLEYQDDSKQKFITALDGELFERHEEFASNPLLLTMMFLTYDEFAEIPETPHLFYERAFETLFIKHDRTKEGYVRKIESGLRSDLFKKVFSTFCCMTYYNNALSFSEGELISILSKVKEEVAKDGITFDIEKYIRDLTNVVCMLYKEGYTYSFTHRSFQEYFTAVYLKDQTDDIMEKRSLAIIKKSVYKATQDETFPMLCGMVKKKFEKNILLPLLNEIENDFIGNDLYDFYFKKMIPSIRFIKGTVFPLTPNTPDYFVLNTYLYIEPQLDDGESAHNSSNAVRQHLNDDGAQRFYYFENNNVYSSHDRFVGDDEVLYNLMRDTWLGQLILAISTARETLTKKYAATADHDDFFSLQNKKRGCHVKNAVISRLVIPGSHNHCRKTKGIPGQARDTSV
ncbi:MAG: hypothetical protein FWC73_03660 [Defluviitaleaceae bacterium]|nr:hypothetical protein [Defluviitaleaceae bacterium]